MNGVVNVYKEAGMTSFQAVAKVRSIFHIKKVGHTGTLDPMAEGVLPICIGNATRFAEILTAGDKQYIANFRLGASYDTYDITGQVTNESEVIPEFEQVGEVLASFKGEQELVVPAFSAKKIEGKRAYELARSGKIEDAGTAKMNVIDIKLVSYTYPDGIFTLDCGKGTYVRSIIHEMGRRLGSFAAMSGLVRSKNGRFDLSTALKLSKLQDMVTAGRINEVLKPVHSYLDLKKAVIGDAEAIKRLLNGISPKRSSYQEFPELEDEESCLIMTTDDKLLALANYKSKTNSLSLSKVFK